MKNRFTLIELLLVVAIIAILVSILMPSLHKAREAAHNAVCLSNQKQTHVAFTIYAKDHKGVLPQNQAHPYGRGHGILIVRTHLQRCLRIKSLA